MRSVASGRSMEIGAVCVVVVGFCGGCSDNALTAAMDAGPSADATEPIDGRSPADSIGSADVGRSSVVDTDDGDQGDINDAGANVDAQGNGGDAASAADTATAIEAATASDAPCLVTNANDATTLGDGSGGTVTAAGPDAATVEDADASTDGAPAAESGSVDDAGADGNTDARAGDGGPPPDLTLSTTTLAFQASCAGSTTPIGQPSVAASPQSFTITNTSGLPTTWAAVVSPSSYVTPASAFSIDPPGSSLNPGESVTLTVTPAPLATVQAASLYEIDTLKAQVLISTGATGGPSQSVTLTEALGGLIIPPGLIPSDISFGNVMVGSEAVFHIPLGNGPTGIGDLILQTVDLNDFKITLDPPGVTPPSRAGWFVSFTPLKPGFQTSTFEIFNVLENVCHPNTFIATGTGVATDGGVPDSAP